MQAHYFQLPTAGAEEAIYRERVYCYELYHQLRVLLQGEEDLARYALSGEIDKRGHQIIRPCIPDLVFHAPGRMDNMVVLEVKPINGELKGIQKTSAIWPTSSPRRSITNSESSWHMEMMKATSHISSVSLRSCMTRGFSCSGIVAVVSGPLESSEV